MASRLSEIDAVNQILTMLALRPVNSLDPADLTPDAAAALAEVRFVNRHVQLLGWHFNTERSVELAKNVDNRVPLTDDIGRVDNAKQMGPSMYSVDIIMRSHPTDGMCLYDKNADAADRDPFDFEHISTVRVDLLRLLDFDETPDSFRHYVTIRAGRNVQARLLTDPTLYRFSTDDEVRALQILQREELYTSDANALAAPGIRQFTRRRSPLNRMESI